MALSASPEPSDKGCLAFGLLWTMVKEELSWDTQKCPDHDFQMRRVHIYLFCVTLQHNIVIWKFVQEPHNQAMKDSQETLTGLSKLTV